MSIEVICPVVIGAAQQFCVSARLIYETCTAVTADIMERANISLLVSDEYQRLVCNRYWNDIAWVWDFMLKTGEYPATMKNAFIFEF